jgi:hypothetical protein
LRKKGFQQDLQQANNLICRWKNDDIILDIMPTNKNILGFTNEWYKQTVNNSIKTDLGDNLIKNMSQQYIF